MQGEVKTRKIAFSTVSISYTLSPSSRRKQHLGGKRKERMYRIVCTISVLDQEKTVYYVSPFRSPKIIYNTNIYSNGIIIVQFSSGCTCCSRNCCKASACIRCGLCARSRGRDRSRFRNNRKVPVLNNSIQVQCLKMFLLSNYLVSLIEAVDVLQIYAKVEN